MPEIITSPIFKKKIITQAQAMVENGQSEAVFVDENSKAYEGLTIYIDQKPTQTLFQFSFPEDFSKGSGKIIYVGTN